MPSHDELKIKDAAQISDRDADTNLQTAGDANEVSAPPEQHQQPASQTPVAADTAEETVQHTWYKCVADPAVYGPEIYYYIDTNTGITQWEEPDEPYWIYNADHSGPDQAGLQYPKKLLKPMDEEKQDCTSDEYVEPAHDVYLGYNPKIHGNWDPNADYAKYHDNLLPKKPATASSSNIPVSSEQAMYESVMAINRFSGHAQSTDLGPDRHSDAAKSGRQMNAFFDVDAAANSHEGRSLKEERKAQKLTKEQVKAFNQSRRDKKMKKRLAFYKS